MKMKMRRYYHWIKEISYYIMYDMIKLTLDVDVVYSLRNRIEIRLS